MSSFRIQFTSLVCLTLCVTSVAFIAPHETTRRTTTATSAPPVSTGTQLALSSTPSSTDQDPQQQRTAVNTLSPAQEEAFLQQCKLLCAERNLPLQKVKNARDLASVQNSNVAPGHIFRMGRVSDATPEDIELLLDDLSLRTLVDLRSPTELKDDPTVMREAVFENFTDIVWKEQGRTKEGRLRALKPGEGPVAKKGKRFWNKKRDFVISESYPLAYSEEDDDIMDEDDDDDDDGFEEPDENGNFQVSKSSRPERHFVSLMNEFKYVKGTVSKLRKRDLTKAILKSPGAILSKRMRTSLKQPFLDEINDGGLPMLNELLLRFGAPGIKYVLELCADEARHPITFYCTAGKDRTGMIAAIILSLTGSKAEEIVEDYTLSANVYAEMNDHQAMVGALSQRNLDPKTFLGAPASVMRDTLVAIESEYGSVEGYCNEIGFGPEKQEQLRKACMKKKD